MFCAYTRLNTRLSFVYIYTLYIRLYTRHFAIRNGEEATERKKERKEVKRTIE